MLRPFISAFPKSEPLFQRNFCSNGYISTKRDQKGFFNGFLESAWIYVSFKKNRLSKFFELQKWCAPLFLLFRKPSHFFSATFVRINFSLRKGIRKCSLMALWKPLGYTFHLNKLLEKILRTPEMARPSVLAFSKPETLFQRKFFSTPERRKSEEITRKALRS